MSPDDAAAYRERWELVRRREIEELRRAPDEQKLAQVAALMASVDAMGWRDALSDDGPVWARWQLLRRRLGVIE